MVRDRIGEGEDRFFATVLLGSGLLFVAMLFATGAVVAGLVLSGENLPAPGVWSFGRRVSYTLLSAASSDTSPARSTNTSHQPPDHIPTPTSLARRIDKHRSIEGSHRTDADEFYRLLDGVVVIDTAEVFNQKLQEWEDFYNFNRPHGGLGGQTPYDRLRQATTKTSA